MFVSLDRGSSFIRCCASKVAAVFRGRGERGGNGNGSGRRGSDIKTGNCCKCGESDHWSRECPMKGSVCGWCEAKGSTFFHENEGVEEKKGGNK